MSPTANAELTRYHARVITVSDRSARGERPDLSGPRGVEMLEAEHYAVDAAVVPDGIDSVTDAITEAIRAGARLIITTGGTGVSPRDLTPEGTRPLLTRELPGITEQLRREGLASSPMAVISRGLAGIAGDAPGSLVINLPGSVGAVEQGLEVLLPVVRHILGQLDGGDH